MTKPNSLAEFKIPPATVEIARLTLGGKTYIIMQSADTRADADRIEVFEGEVGDKYRVTRYGAFIKGLLRERT